MKMEKFKVIDIKLGKGYFQKSDKRSTFRIDMVVNQDIETSLEFRNYIAEKIKEFFTKSEKKDEMKRKFFESRIKSQNNK